MDLKSGFLWLDKSFSCSFLPTFYISSGSGEMHFLFLPGLVGRGRSGWRRGVEVERREDMEGVGDGSSVGEVGNPLYFRKMSSPERRIGTWIWHFRFYLVRPIFLFRWVYSPLLLLFPFAKRMNVVGAFPPHPYLSPHTFGQTCFRCFFC